MDHDDLYDDLYAYFADSGDMPYGTQKARDGDPYEWVHNKLDDLGLIGEDDTMDVKIDKDGAISKDDGHEEKEQKTPLGEFILSYFDRENGAFPKGETAVLTMVEKDYGDEYINPAKEFIEQITAKFDEWQMRTQPQQMEAPDTGEHDRIRELAGLR